MKEEPIDVVPLAYFTSPHIHHLLHTISLVNCAVSQFLFVCAYGKASTSWLPLAQFPLAFCSFFLLVLDKYQVSSCAERHLTMDLLDSASRALSIFQLLDEHRQRPL